MKNSRIGTKSSFSNSKGRGSWLVTFADLLTLLLCFFLLIISSGPTWNDKKADNSATYDQQASIEKDLRGDPSLTPNGISLAQSNSGTPSIVTSSKVQLEISEAEFQVGDLLYPRILDFREKALSQMNNGETILIESCDRNEGLNAWNLSDTRAVEVWKALLRQGVNSRIIEVSPRGKFCPRAEREDSVAFISLIKSHG